MDSRDHPRETGFLRLGPGAPVAGATALGVGVLVLIGWAGDLETLKRILPGFVAMNPLTAVGFVLAGASLILQRPRERTPARVAGGRGAQAMAVLVMLIGGVKLIEYGAGIEIGLDRWLFTERLDVAGQEPNRIAPNTAFNFVLCGLALLLLDVRTPGGRKPSEFLGLAVALISLLAITGYFYQVQWLYGVSAFIPMALHTALTFHLLGIGLIRARPVGGLMGLWTSDTAGGVLLRWQLPGAVLILFSLGWLRLEGERRGLYGTELGVALHTTATVVIFGILIGWSARVLKRADAARRQEEAERERFFSLSLDLLGIAATDGYFKRINPAFTATLGWSREEFLGRPFLEFVHPDDAAATLAEVDRLKQGQVTVAFENRYRCRDGSYRWISWKAQPFVSEGLLYCTGHDVTAQRESSAAIQQLNTELKRHAVQLAEANRELESFSYSVSHDLRAPLRHIHGYAEMLAATSGAGMGERPRRFLQTILDASAEMGRLIDDLLTFSRTNRAGLERQEVVMDELLQEALRGQEQSVGNRDIRWKLSPLPVVLGDRAMLRQVLVNLVDNAIKYTRGRAPAEIEVGCSDDSPAEVTIFVRDNGAGFDMRYAHKLFGVFQRLHRSDEFEGTGIGLATVRRIVSRHGGRTWAEGRLNAGAVFYFTLPRAGVGSDVPRTP